MSSSMSSMSVDKKAKRKPTNSCELSKAAKKPKITQTTKYEKGSSWLKIFEPKSVEDLLLHPKKLQDLRNWFTLTREASKRNRILLLTGPTGCLKLSSARLLAKEANYDLSEWITMSNAIERDLLVDEQGSHNYQKQSESFCEFLLKSSRYTNIFSNKDRVLIVKDFPNAFLRKGHEEEFFEILKTFKNEAKTPLIFIITQSSAKSLNIEYRLFPENIKILLGIECISMNPITATNMKRALKMIIATMKTSDEGIDHVDDLMIDSIVTQSQGDIRNAVNNLQLIAQQGQTAYDLKTASRRNTKTGKIQKGPKAKIEKGIGRDEQLDIFHGVGRALYPKWENDKLVHNPETLTDVFSSQPRNYIELLHSNYMKRFGSLSDICRLGDLLSVVDNLQYEYRENNTLELMSLNLVIRGAMVYNSTSASGFQPITSYANKKFKPNEEKFLQKYEEYSNKCGNCFTTKKNFFCDYISLIKKE